VLRRNDLPDPHLPSLHLALRSRYSEDSWGGQLLRRTRHITDVELTPSSGHRFPIGVSDLVKDCDMDVASLTGFSCDMTTTDVVRYTAAATASPPTEQPRLVCGETEGLHSMSRSSLDAPRSVGFYRFVEVLSERGCRLGCASY
jgi:hypothetical protein